MRTRVPWQTSAALLVALALGACAGPVKLERGKAAVVARSGDGAQVLLYNEQGPCVGEARFAEYVAPDGSAVPGCWVVAGGGLVLISYLDGERGNIPYTHLKQVSEL